MSSPSMTSPSTAPPPTKAKVLIVGAGIGGLVLAALLEKAGIEYNVYERAKEVIPLGSAISLGPNVLYFFEQLGVADEIKANSKIIMEAFHYDDDLKEIGHHVYSYHKDRYGDYSYIIARPILYDIIARLVPKEKIQFGAKVLSFLQNKEGVMIRTWDNQTHHGDILVGADGAYSAVRQSLYQQLEEKGQLPASDKEMLPFTNVCLVGTTEPLDLEKFKFLGGEESYFIGVISEKPYTWVVFSTTDNRICWMVVEHLNKNNSKGNDSFRNSEWGPEAAEAMCNEVRDFPFPHGITIGDYIDRTPKELISKVMLEEKLFETWHDGRTVLLGDACHKMHPAAGLGAVSAIQDAIVLASRLYELPSTKLEDVDKVFKEYRAERYPLAIKSYESSKNMAKLIANSWVNILVRKITKYMPLFLWLKVLDALMAYRPQVTFLPLIPDRGTMKPAKQTSLELAKKFPQSI
ncbi:hypothetical protein EDD21DRAFT_442467 [Dissophora ornata]|nr:hypothetical protein BGZ58_009580 [Dissophora ornata]KAI8602920.1 hypothetical protein EDD21DRAFT_442467 [Dissophora ornata]